MKAPPADRLVLDVKNAFAPFCEGGLYEEELEQSFERLQKIQSRLEKQRAEGRLPFWNLPYQDAMREECERLAAETRGKFDTLVVLGIGGSALGTKAVLAAVRPEALSGAGAPRVFVADNVDPTRFTAILAACDPARTAFNVISKSGETAETAALMLAAEAWLRKAKQSPAEHLIVTTDATSGSLRRYVERKDLHNLWVPEGVGGRFSVLTPVGLFPCAFAG
ncbi:MAG: glucose-6-phosphate isomerase, partial [Candidatus Methylomirabilis sp.]|nr:glucose-6-phosphate isomerase [Deltaproteobacteria bacterium]